MGTSHLEKGQDEVFTKKFRPPPPQIRLNLAKLNRKVFVSSSMEFALISLQVTCVAVQLGPMGLFPAKNLIHLAENNGFEDASLAERGTEVKDMRTVAHGSLNIQFASLFFILRSNRYML